jgi:hypothetical protein
VTVEPEKVDPGPGLTITAGPGTGLENATLLNEAITRNAIKMALPTRRIFAVELFMLESTKSSESKPFG